MLLITGATGFVGLRLLNLLEKKDYPRNKILLLSSQKIEGYNCIDHTNYTYSVDSLREYEIEAVIHLGSVTPKGNGDEQIRDYLENIRTTVHLIENLPNVPKKMIFASSVSVYEQNTDVIDETSILTTSDVYGMTKILCEYYLKEWADKNDVALQIFRIAPVYGPGEETYKKIVSTFLEQAIKGEAITIFSDGNELRNMIYVDDLCECIHHTVMGGEDSDITNLTSIEHISVKELAEIAVQLTNSRSEIIIRKEKSGRTDRFNTEKLMQKYGDVIAWTSYQNGMKKMYLHYLIEKAEIIYFDLDGTILDETMRHYRCYCDIVAKYGGKSISLDEYWKDKRNKQKRTILLEKTHFGGTYDDYLGEWLNRIEQMDYLIQETLKPGVIQFLKSQKKKKKKLILVTMRRCKENLMKQLNHLGLIDYFDEIVTGDPTKTKKEDLIEPSNEKKAIVIGDTEAEMKLAQKVSAKYIAVTTGLREPQYLEADFYVEQISELL